MTQRRGQKPCCGWVLHATGSTPDLDGAENGTDSEQDLVRDVCLARHSRTSETETTVRHRGISVSRSRPRPTHSALCLGCVTVLLTRMEIEGRVRQRRLRRQFKPLFTWK